jgi:uncharacterized DUF497 family protein
MTAEFDWDEDKSKKLKKTRGFGFDEVSSLLVGLYVERTKNDDPEQFAATGFIGGKCITLIYECREIENRRQIYWLVTKWPATRQEREMYAKETKNFHRGN